MLLLTLLLNGIFAFICYSMGTSKGYSGGLCGVAGFFGGIIAIIIIALLPDQVAEADAAARRSRRQEDEIDALKRRIAELEASQPKPPQEPTAEEPAPAEQPVGTPVTFPARTDAIIACPRCGKKQSGRRDACYSCKTPFLYENE